MYEQQSLLTAELDEATGTTAHSDAQPPQQAQTAPAVKYYPINEDTARRAHEMMSMSDYPANRATGEYRAAVDEAAALVERCKAATSPYYHDKLDALLDRYARRLAQWKNDYNRNGASCPSVLVCGPANFPTRKKERQNAREASLWQEYNGIQAILDKIKSVGSGPVDLADPHAREMLTDQLQQLQNRLDTGKAMNTHYRKHKTMQSFPGISDETAAQMDEGIQSAYSWAQKPMPDYELNSLRGKIKRVQARLDELTNRAEQAEQSAESTKFDGGEIVRNLEADRLQIFFDEIPPKEVRQALSGHGFHFSRSNNNAWQRKLTRNAEYDARRILGLD